MIKYLTVEQVLEMHDAFIEKFGGLHGIRDMNLLLSAIETPKATKLNNKATLDASLSPAK